MDPRTQIRTLAAAAAIALAIIGSPVGLTLAAPIDKEQFKDECEAGGGKYFESENHVTCEHKIEGDTDTIKILCNKTTGVCTYHVNGPTSGTGRAVPAAGTGQQIESVNPIVPVQDGKPRRR